MSTGSSARACAWSPDGDQLAAATTSGVQIFDTVTGHPLHTLTTSVARWLRLVTRRHPTRHRSRRRSPDLRHHHRPPLHTLTTSGSARACAWSPDGTQLATASRRSSPDLRHHHRPPTAHPDHRRLRAGLRLVTRRHPTRRRHHRRNPDLRHRHRPPTAHPDQQQLTWGCAWSPDGTQLAAASRNGVQIFDTATRHRMHTLAASLAQDCAWSPDGTQLAAVSLLAVQIFDTATGHLMHTLAAAAEAGRIAPGHPTAPNSPPPHHLRIPDLRHRHRPPNAHPRRRPHRKAAPVTRRHPTSSRRLQRDPIFDAPPATHCTPSPLQSARKVAPGHPDGTHRRRHHQRRSRSSTPPPATPARSTTSPPAALPAEVHLVTRRHPQLATATI